MEEINRNQRLLVEEFNKLLTAIKKDPVDRRTRPNIEKRRGKLEELWNNFSKNQDNAKKLGKPDNDLFDEGEKTYDTIGELLNRYESQLEQEEPPKEEKTVQSNDRTKINQLKKKLEIILNDINGPMFLDDHQTERELNWKLQTLTSRWEKIQELYESIENDSSVSQKVFDTKTEVDSTTRRLFEKIEAATVRKSVHLPEINIPVFKGAYEEWATFHDLFTKVIHQRQHLSKVEKFQYLKTRLSGEPGKLIRNLTISEANYDTAWETLKNRYHNEKLLTFTLLDKIFNFPKIHGESAAKLKDLHDTIQDCTTAISNLGIDTSSWSVMLNYMIMSKWDDNTSQLFEQNSEPNKLPDHDKVMKFMISRFQSLEASAKKPTDNSAIKTKSSCKHCRGDHHITQCEKFKTMSTEERRNLIRKINLCLRCMKHSNQVKCYDRSSCYKCGKYDHHTLLHQAPKSPKPNTQETAKRGAGNTAVKQTSSNEYEVLLATAVVKARAVNGEWINLRVLLDSGSQMSFITENGAQMLGLPRQRTQVVISGIGGSENSTPKSKICAEMQPRFPSSYRLTAELTVLSKVTANLPHSATEDVRQEEWKNWFLADPTFNKPGPIDILLGSDVLGDVYLPEMMKTKKGPTAHSTQFGWVLSGIMKKQDIPSIKNVRSMISRKEEDDQLTKFWRIEEVPESKPLSEEERKCEEIYEKTTTREDDGKYTVRLPFKSDPDNLGQSRSRAMARFFQTERKLEKDVDRYQQYKAFMQEYEDLGHMERTNDIEGGKYYIPHQAVIREDSSTTKLRVVFDASCKTSSGESLNEKLHNGPRLQEDIPSILLRWRIHAVVFKADIEKMYRQIMIHPDDQDYQRILWRASKDEPIKEYKLRTVTYGTTSAPYLAIKTLQRLAADESQTYPLAANAIMDFYVDDVLSGANSIDEAIRLQKQLNALMESGGMTLRKWSSNHIDLINMLPAELQDNQEMELNKEDTKKSLGVHWNPKLDVFLFKVKIRDITPSKRNILSEIAKLYDPLGWLSPITVVAKMMIQELWIKNLEWDQPVPEDMKKKWEMFSSKIKSVEKIYIPRWIHWSNNQTIELHGFADSSEKAYGAAVYSRITQADGSIKTSLLVSKSKVAPLKMKKTLPRLELCAAELLSKLMEQVKQALKLESVTVHGWTDSMITLAWIKGDPSRWKNFVANRVARINEHLPAENWNHVKTNENPADLVSRGVDPTKLQDMMLWWRGPSWLSEQKDRWQLTTEIGPTNEEAKVNVLMVQKQDPVENVLDRFSTYTRMLRVMSWCWRFTQKCRKINEPNPSDELSVSEMKEMLKRIIRYTQNNHMSDDVQSLTKRKTVQPKSCISSLAPYIDDDGIIRVGGRIKHAQVPVDHKHPIILPKNCTLATLIIRNAHAVTLHGGNQLTLAYCRRRYWIIHGKQMVRSIIKRCPTCIRYKGETLDNIMGNLPEPRINPSPPFYHTGIDYAGPIQLRVSKGRGTKSYKGYIAVFVCFVTKAVHLEIVSDMTSDAFLAAFRRFISRRGPCAHIYSDNGTNFVGANKFIQNTMATQGMQWHFIPPAAPHFGGLWESAVKSMKHHLKRIVGEATLTYEEMSTLTQQIEACMNSRPLWPLTNDPEDMEALTPGHFLIGRAILSPAETALDDDVINHSTRWTMIQKMKTSFWKIWSSEYLHNMQQRMKWRQRKPNIEKGDLVLVKDDNLPPGRWPLARIAEVHSADDDTVRVVTLRQADKKQVKRPICKLVPLESSTADVSGRACNTGIRTRLSNGPKILVMSLCLLSVFTICTANFTIKPVPPGVYVEHIGHARINRGTFRLDVSISKSQIYKNADNVNNSISSLEDLCQKASKFHSDIQCIPLLHHLKEQQQEFEWVIQSISHTTHSRRVKRNLLGKAMTYIFGVNDEVYQDIEKLDENQQKLIRTSTHQTKLLLSATSDIKSTERRLNNTLQRLTSKINKGIAAINQMTSWYHYTDRNNLNVVMNIMETYQIANSYIEDVHEVSNKILDLVLGRGHIYQFVSPAQVITSLHHISEKLPHNVEIWPSPVIKTTYTQTNESIIVMGYFIISETADYTLMKLTPTPLHIKENTYWIADVTQNFLAVEYNSQLYYEMTDQELRSSLQLDDLTYLTSPTIIKSIQHTPDCFIDYLYDRKDNFTCPVYQRSITAIIWKQLYMPNAWMFIANMETRIAIICSGVRAEIKINQTGVIVLTQDCTIQTGQSILNTIINARAPVLSSSVKVLAVNLSELKNIAHQPKIQLETEPVINLADHHDNMGLDDPELLNDNTWKQVHHHVATAGILTTSGWFLVLCLITILIKFFWNRWRSTQQPRTSRPQPAQEQNRMMPRDPESCFSPAVGRRSWPPRQDVQNEQEH